MCIELGELGELERKDLLLRCLRSMTRRNLGRKCPTLISISQFQCIACAYKLTNRLINVLKAANQPVPDELLKFGTTVKKKEHEAYGAFAKDVDMTQKAKKIKFD
jgi:hypothetical protein